MILIMEDTEKRKRRNTFVKSYHWMNTDDIDSEINEYVCVGGFYGVVYICS